MEWSAWTYEALPKTILYAALLVIGGTAVSRWMVATLTGPVSELDQALERFGVVASSVALAALLLRVFGHTATVFGAADALHWSNIRVIAIESRWGQAWHLQFIAAVAVMACAFSIRLKRHAGWLLYTIAAFALCAMIPRLGHGATSIGHLLLHILHLVGVSAWLGTLTVIVWLYFRNSQVRDTMAILLQRFSTIALPAAGLTAITGVIAAAIYVESFSNLLTTAYGRTLLIKIGGFVCIMTCGWSNWRRMRTSKAPRPQTLIAELVFTAAVLVITGVLTETEHS
ncbi:MAG: CopD family protein [Bryobacteraceae bacterium]|jgi:putative copper export protein